MILLDSQVVSGNTGVLPAMQRLGHDDFQCTILMDHILVIILNAHLAVFVPNEEKKRQLLFRSVLKKI